MTYIAYIAGVLRVLWYLGNAKHGQPLGVTLHYSTGLPHHLAQTDVTDNPETTQED